MPSVYMARLEEGMARARKNLEEEKEFSALNNIKRPDLIAVVWNLKAEEIEGLALPDIENYMYAMAQYTIFMQAHINQIKVGYITAKRIYESLLTEKALDIRAKKEYNIKSDTISAYESIAATLPELREVEDKMVDLEQKLAVYANIPDQIIEKLNTLKKIYSNKTDMRLNKHES